MPLDAWAGLGRRSLTAHARRMVTLAGASWSFDRAAAALRELCHVDVSDDTVERVCQEEGAAAQAWLAGPPPAGGGGPDDEPARAFAAAAGRAEFYTDGVTVNTVGGWREMRLSVFARREPAAGCGPGDWARRRLNEPTARLATCAVAGADRVGASWARQARRLGLSADDGLSVVADGARWIWDQAAKRFGPRCPAEWCVDVYHVSEHLHACGRAVRGGEGPAARAWADERLAHALAHDGVGLIARLGAERAGEPDPGPIDRLLGYLAANRDSLWYRGRLARGLPIGSGLVEGACKGVVAARLKANSARWRVRRVERVGALRCLDYSGQWDAFWAARAAA